LSGEISDEQLMSQNDLRWAGPKIQGRNISFGQTSHK